MLSLLCHGAIFLSTLGLSIGVPIGILFVSDDPVVKDNAKEAINFHLNVWLYAIILVPLSFVTFGLAGLIGFAIHWGLTIMAILHVFQSPNESYRYPFIFRLV
ncbi:MAG: DUF4870 domain-containing protein [Tychonema bourrellyi B0820]|uniref:DUF4870 domain-containing protein n=1 Tax=Tychonema bourrellyi FEM_GT703 TaxID=2040638 RepID=A0A2G4EZR9_9CYAN|nr:DUF4870 domain-containing protein [Tychonema bourrellyi]MDQ2097852.1 DUF4870 domain-containing protein [Tychonema bourrellyi B0820]PHX55000.1 DUF4870 domain-containing protein [Tychonema bourrellyi FEM_GT703]